MDQNQSRKTRNTEIRKSNINSACLECPRQVLQRVQCFSFLNACHTELKLFCLPQTAEERT